MFFQRFFHMGFPLEAIVACGSNMTERDFHAGGDMPDVDVVVNGDYVRQHLGEDGKVMDMKRYIL